uniref:hypothetical protein n=1 Tax=Candidatus Scatomorpha intestinigallinarum TaxID=2840923 RepID=UPI0040271755
GEEPRLRGVKRLGPRGRGQGGQLREQARRPLLRARAGERLAQRLRAGGGPGEVPRGPGGGQRQQRPVRLRLRAGDGLGQLG